MQYNQVLQAVLLAQFELQRVPGEVRPDIQLPDDIVDRALAAWQVQQQVGERAGGRAGGRVRQFAGAGMVVVVVVVERRHRASLACCSCTRPLSASLL